MDLQLSDVAELLNVSNETIERWIQDKTIPYYEMSGEYRFSRMEIENWMMNNKEDIGAPQKGGVKQFSLFRAVHKGGVLTNVPGNNKEEVIRNVVKEIAPTLELDAAILADLLLDREKLMPTALGEGIAVPHTRDLIFNGHFDVVTVAFPETPVDFGSLDGKPVHVLFFLFACDDKRHLNLLAKVAHLGSDEVFKEMLKSQPNKEQLLAAIKNWEKVLSPVSTN